MQDFDLLSEITDIEIIARGMGVDIRKYLYARYGRARWRKLKGRAWICVHSTGAEVYAEIHWYEAHGIGRRDFKRKRVLRGR